MENTIILWPPHGGDVPGKTICYERMAGQVSMDDHPSYTLCEERVEGAN